jgi:internalin A
MKKVIALISGLALSLQTLPVGAIATQQSKPKTFSQWCQQRNSVPEATKVTIDLLLKQAATQDCKQADSKLRNLTKLDLSGDGNSGIQDIQPLASLTNLTSLNLGFNQITDIKPLAGLTKLTMLSLSKNKISNLEHNNIVNLKPLSGLNKLISLRLGNPSMGYDPSQMIGKNSNKISDVKPLAGLINLTSLDLSYSMVNDISSLQKLKNLTSFTLDGNKIEPQVCPVQPSSICGF